MWLFVSSCDTLLVSVVLASFVFVFGPIVPTWIFLFIYLCCFCCYFFCYRNSKRNVSPNKLRHKNSCQSAELRWFSCFVFVCVSSCSSCCCFLHCLADLLACTAIVVLRRHVFVSACLCVYGCVLEQMIAKSCSMRVKSPKVYEKYS